MWKLLLCLVIALTFVGCNSINSINKQNGQFYTKTGDQFLDYQIEITEIDEFRQGEALGYNVVVKSSSFLDLSLEIKMDFYDGQDHKLDNAWGWRPLELPAGQSETIKFIAPNLMAKNIRLSIKKAGN